MIGIKDNIIRQSCIAMCRNWPKIPDGCAALCMDRLGETPKEGCKHAVDVHGTRVRVVLSTALRALAEEILKT